MSASVTVALTKLRAAEVTLAAGSGSEGWRQRPSKIWLIPHGSGSSGVVAVTKGLSTRVCLAEVNGRSVTHL
jgi:hypothetical protein